jgi:hypothetical protein
MAVSTTLSSSSGGYVTKMVPSKSFTFAITMGSQSEWTPSHAVPLGAAFDCTGVTVPGHITTSIIDLRQTGWSVDPSTLWYRTGGCNIGNNVTIAVNNSKLITIEASGSCGITSIYPPSTASSLAWTGAGAIPVIYTGDICVQACANGGTCIGWNQCACTAEFGGDTCTEVIVPDCGVCLNGFCNGEPVGHCQCYPQWSGADCHIPLCTPTCVNGGTCGNDHTCSCSFGWGGNDCSVAVCTLGCENGGTCTATSTGGVCQCTDQWFGPSCTQMLCTQGYTCIHGSCQGFGCNCDAGIYSPLPAR